jgi:thiamine biosynthesis lipoprotein
MISSKKYLPLFFAVIAILISNCGTKREPVRRTRLMFDTVVSISIETEKGRDLEPIFAEIWRELGDWEKSLSAYDSSGGIYRVNMFEEFELTSPKLESALEIGLDYLVKTSGAFDIRVGGIIRLWDFTGEGDIPSDSALSEAMRFAGNPVEINDGRIRKSLGTKLDLGGLGKGIAADAIAEMLDTIPFINRYIIDLGGNIASGDKAGKPFAIGIRHPRAPEEVIAKFKLESGKACATAGDYQRFFERDGVRYHHIIDPQKGIPARHVSAVTVIAPDAVTADILSTALFVMGFDDGMEFLSDNPEIRACFFDLDGEYLGGNLLIEIF